MKATPKKSFLLRQDEIEGGKRKDVIAREGVQIDVTEKEAVKFFGLFRFSDAEKRKLVNVSRERSYLRTV